jgi:hypothetical protein
MKAESYSSIRTPSTNRLSISCSEDTKLVTVLGGQLYSPIKCCSASSRWREAAENENNPLSKAHPVDVAPKPASFTVAFYAFTRFLETYMRVVPYSFC